MTPEEVLYHVDQQKVDCLTKCVHDSLYQRKHGVLPEVKLNQIERNMRTVYDNQKQMLDTLIDLKNEINSLKHKSNQVKRSSNYRGFNNRQNYRQNRKNGKKARNSSNSNGSNGNSKKPWFNWLVC